MVHLFYLPGDVIGLFGEFIPLERLAVNTESLALVAQLAPRAEPIWESLCRELCVCSSFAHGQTWRKRLVLCVQPLSVLGERRAVVVALRQAVIGGDSKGVCDLLKAVSRFEVPTDMLCDALRLNHHKLGVLRELFASGFGTAPDAANHLGEALIAHASDPSVHIFRAIAHHLQRWNIKITALHYNQAALRVHEQESWRQPRDFERVPAPDAV